MKIAHDLLSDERGVSTLEFILTFIIVMLVIMSIYDVLKFQNDIGMVSYNEQIAKHRVDLARLNEDSNIIKEGFESSLNEANKNEFFSSLQYYDLTMECYSGLSLKYSIKCNEKIKLIKFSYKVRRKYTDNFVSALLNIPVVFDREIFVVNDYYN